MKSRPAFALSAALAAFVLTLLQPIVAAPPVAAQTCDNGFGGNISIGVCGGGGNPGNSGGGPGNSGGGGSPSPYTFVYMDSFPRENLEVLAVIGCVGAPCNPVLTAAMRHWPTCAGNPEFTGVSVTQMLLNGVFVQYDAWCDRNGQPTIPRPPSPAEIWEELTASAELLPPTMAPAPNPHVLVGTPVRVRVANQGTVTVGPINNGLCSVAAAARPMEFVWRLEDSEGNAFVRSVPATGDGLSIDAFNRKGRFTLSVATRWEGNYNLVCGGGDAAVPTFAAGELSLGAPYLTPYSAGAPIVVSEVKSLLQ